MDDVSSSAFPLAGPERVGEPYALSPMQAGMLFQSILQGGTGAGGYDVEQMHVLLEGDLRLPELGRAWDLVARRHPVLTTSFQWAGEESPTQRLNCGIAIPVEVADWRRLGEGERAVRREEALQRDRARGFDLRSPPLMRVAVFRLEGMTEILWSFHHILLDGRSMVTVLGDLFEAYDAFCGRQEPNLAAPPPPYRDYIAWLGALDTRTSLLFFRDLLRGKNAPTPLPVSEAAARPLPRHGYGETIRVIEDRVAESARELGRRTGTTLGSVIQAAWAIVLARFTGDDDVVFGATRACRRSALDGRGADSMVGLFINTLPVRARITDDRLVSELLADLRAQSLAMRDHEHTPLVEIQGQSEIPRGQPLFETLLVFENREMNRSLRARDPRWRSRISTLHEQPSPALNVTVFDDGRLELRLLFKRSLYRDDAIDRLGAALATAIEEVARGEGRRIGDVDVLPGAERRRLLVEWNDTARPFPDDLCIHEPFERQALLQPDAVAVEARGEALRYGELEARANRLAHALRARGAGPGVYVGVCLERGLELVVALIAIAKSGAAYVPLDADYPAERLAFMLEDARALLVVTEQRFAPLFATAVLVIDGADAAEIASRPAERLPRAAASSDVCYAIYTSGSTGVPKGVVLSHRAVVNTFDWVTRTLEVGPGDRLLFVTSPCFDLSVYDTFGALGAGATVVVATRAELAEPEALAAAVVSREITIWDSAPAALQRIVPFFPKASKTAPLRLVMLSGDWIPLPLPNAVREAFPRASVVSLGGATEAAIWSNWFPVGTIDPRWTSVPYGRPIQNARYHVLDHRMEPVPVGVTGDLYIGGACLAQGYLNRPELTRERFVVDPFDTSKASRLYRTGDLARYFPDGDLEFLGRADFQVKIRGFRVEMGEVEAALTAMPGIDAAVCTAHEDASRQKSLLAYVVLTTRDSLNEAEIKRAIADKLPDFMVPSRVIALEALPVSSNGKVDRKRLPGPDTWSQGEGFVAAESDLERQIVAIWEELLQRKPIGVCDSFFDLGGHSLLAVMLVSRMQERLGLEVPLARILQRPTIRSLAESIEEARRGPLQSRHLVTLRREGKRAPLFLVAGSGGYGFVFQRLTGALGPEQPFHTLQAVDSDDGETRFRGIEEIAASYEAEVLEVCGDGPLVLGGYSFGVLVAFELAHRLRSRRDVPLIISLDGFAPGIPRLLPLPLRLVDHAREFLHRDRDARARYVRTRLKRVQRRLLTRLGSPEDALPDIPFANEKLNAQLRRLEAGLWRARQCYAPTHRLGCEMLLIKSETPERWVGTETGNEVYGWNAFVTGSIHVETIPGEHLTFFQVDNCQRIADAISKQLARVQGPPHV